MHYVLVIHIEIRGSVTIARTKRTYTSRYVEHKIVSIFIVNKNSTKKKKISLLLFTTSVNYALKMFAGLLPATMWH